LAKRKSRGVSSAFDVSSTLGLPVTVESVKPHGALSTSKVKTKAVADHVLKDFLTREENEWHRIRGLPMPGP